MARHRAERKPPTDWHKADIKAALEKQGWSLRRLAAKLNLNHRTLAHAFQHRYPASERRIADALGVHPMVIWPSRYNADGTSNGRRGNPNWLPGIPQRGNRSTRGRREHVKNSRAN